MVIGKIVACVKIDPDGGTSMVNARGMAVGKMVATSKHALVIVYLLARSKMVAGSVEPLVIKYELASGKMKGNTPRRVLIEQSHHDGRGHAASLDWARNSPTVQQPET